MSTNEKREDKPTETTQKPRTAGSCTNGTTTPTVVKKAVKGGGIDGDPLEVRHGSHG